MRNFLKVINLSVSAHGKTIVQGINLTVKAGEVHALMGPNGSGKSTLALSLGGHPDYKIESGKVIMDKDDLLQLKPDQRTRLGLFLTFQNPVSVEGVTLEQLAWSILRNMTVEVDLEGFHDKLENQAKILGLKEELLECSINDGFSGGEKKKGEVLLLSMVPVKFVIFDEIDSGMDIDSLKKIAEVIKDKLKKHAGIILITHNQRILKMIPPDFVHVLRGGKIVKSGNQELAFEVEKRGYAKI